MKMRAVLLFSTLGVCLCMGHAQTGASYDALIQQGKTELQAGNSAQALASGQQAVQLDANRWEAYALAGGALMNLKRYEEAADALSESIKHAPPEKQDGLRALRKQCALAEAGVTPTPQQHAAPPQPAATSQAEVVLWKTIETSTSPDDFNGYLTQYPNGAFVVLARKHLSDLQQLQMAREAAERAKLPVETPALGGTLIRYQGQMFLVFSNPQVSVPMFFAQSGGERCVLVFGTYSYNGDARGFVAFFRDHVMMSLHGVTVTHSYSDFAAKEAGNQTLVTIRLVNKENLFPKHKDFEVDLAIDSKGIFRLIENLQSNAEDTLHSIPGLSTRTALPDVQSFGDRQPYFWDSATHRPYQ
jgi:hypothetical protein